MKNDLYFENVLAVFDFLRRDGWKVTHSTVYRHRSEGKVRPGKDGLFTAAAVRRYAKIWLKKKDPISLLIEQAPEIIETVAGDVSRRDCLINLLKRYHSGVKI